MSNKVYLKALYGYREDVLENWQAANPVLNKGEPSIVRDGAEGEWLKIGDGKTSWNDLPWKKGPRGDAGPIGPQGPAGDDYILTQADKEEIADMAKPEIDQTYNPESQNAQSGIAVAEAIGKWEKIVDITTTEEANGIIATVEEFPKIAKCKEFIVRVIFQKHNGTTSLQLGSSRLYFNEVLSYQINNTSVSYAAISELKAHIQFIDTLVHTIATEGLTGQAALTGGVKMLVGPRFVTEEVNEIKYLLSITTNMLPIGTQFVVYGKVEG